MDRMSTTIPYVLGEIDIVKGEEGEKSGIDRYLGTLQIWIITNPTVLIGVVFLLCIRQIQETEKKRKRKKKKRKEKKRK
jgi:hypothetical protein